MREFTARAVLADTGHVLKRRFLPFFALALIVFGTLYAVSMFAAGRLPDLTPPSVAEPHDAITASLNILKIGLTYVMWMIFVDGTDRILRGNRASSHVSVGKRFIRLVPIVLLFVGISFLGVLVPQISWLVGTLMWLLALLILPPILIEGGGILTGCNRARYLIKGLHKKVFGIVLLFYVFVFAFWVAISWAVADFSAGFESLDVEVAAVHATRVFLKAAATVLDATVATAIYVHLRWAKDGPGTTDGEAVID